MGPENDHEPAAVRAAYRHTKDVPRNELYRRRDGFRGPRDVRTGGYGERRVRTGFSALPSDDFDAYDMPEPENPVRDARRHDGSCDASPPSRSNQQAQAASPNTGSWEKYNEPQTGREWFWNTVTEETFFADDDKSGWERYEDASGAPWWWHEASQRHFYEEE